MQSEAIGSIFVLLVQWHTPHTSSFQNNKVNSDCFIDFDFVIYDKVRWLITDCFERRKQERIENLKVIDTQTYIDIRALFKVELSSSIFFWFSLNNILLVLCSDVRHFCLLLFRTWLRQKNFFYWFDKSVTFKSI